MIQTPGLSIAYTAICDKIMSILALVNSGYRDMVNIQRISTFYQITNPFV